MKPAGAHIGAPPLAKNEARVQGRAARKGMAAAFREGAARRLERGLPQHPLVVALEPGPVLVPTTHRDEIPTEPLAKALEQAGWTLVRPRSLVRQHAIEAVPWPFAKPLVHGFGGILEPPPEAARMDAAGLRLVLVPGLAFAASGARVGTGAGFFDRFLAPLRSGAARPTVIGIGYRSQLLSGIATEPHDVPMDGLQLEDLSVACRASRRT